MYHKMITNKPTYFIDTGTIVNAGKNKNVNDHDLLANSEFEIMAKCQFFEGKNKGEYGRKNATAQYFTYFGDSEGKPVARRGWVVNCQVCLSLKIEIC